MKHQILLLLLLLFFSSSLLFFKFSRHLGVDTCNKPSINELLADITPFSSGSLGGSNDA